MVEVDLLSYLGDIPYDPSGQRPQITVGVPLERDEYAPKSL